jgi:hypothetical protein
MIRKQIYLEAHHQESVRSLSASIGISEAEVIRRAIDHELGPRPSGASTGAHPDPAAWNRALNLMRSTQRKRKGSKKVKSRKWSRKELYEDRLSRYD